jgi:type IV pilus assembly protein PilC
VEVATGQVMAAIEPMIIILLAAVVGTVIFAVIMPMMSMYPRWIACKGLKK